MRVCHGFTAVFDDPALVSCAGSAPGPAARGTSRSSKARGRAPADRQTWRGQRGLEDPSLVAGVVAGLTASMTWRCCATAGCPGCPTGSGHPYRWDVPAHVRLWSCPSARRGRVLVAGQPEQADSAAAGSGCAGPRRHRRHRPVDLRLRQAGRRAVPTDTSSLAQTDAGAVFDAGRLTDRAGSATKQSFTDAAPNMSSSMRCRASRLGASHMQIARLTSSCDTLPRSSKPGGNSKDSPIPRSPMLRGHGSCVPLRGA